MKELFQNRNYKLLFFGNLVSELGNVLFGFVAGLYVADLTGKPSMLAIFMALGAGIRIIASPLAGVLVDRWDKVRIIYGTDFLRGIIFVVTAYLFYNGLNQTAATVVLLTVVGLSGLISAFFGPAIISATPEIVGLEKLQAANGANSIVTSFTAIAGVLFGIIAFSFFTFEVAVLINGVSFVASGLSEMFIKAKYKGEVPSERKSMKEDFVIGFKYIKEREGLLNLMMYSLFLNFAFSPLFSVGFPSLMRIQLDRNAWEIGWLDIVFSIAMMGSGIVIGSIKLKSMGRTIRTSLFFLVLTFMLMTLNIYFLSLDLYSYWVFYGIFMAMHVSMAIFMMATNVPLNTGMVKIIDPSVRGRVFATIGALASGLTPVAIILAGYLIEATSVAFLGFVCSLILLVPTFGFITNKKVRALLQSIEDETNILDQEQNSTPIEDAYAV